jgi:DNA-binding transcriptional regulator LsrR (DeoR family)
MGNIGHELMNLDFNELARSAGKAFGARVIYLNAPAIMSSGSSKELIASSDSIRYALQMARSADMFVVGIGSIQADSIFSQVGLISDAALDELKNAGAVGDICARFFDQTGNIIPSSFDDRITGIRLEDLCGHGFTVGVSGGAEKVIPLLGALRGNFLNALVTDELTANGILEQQ